MDYKQNLFYKMENWPLRNFVAVKLQISFGCGTHTHDLMQEIVIPKPCLFMIPGKTTIGLLGRATITGGTNFAKSFDQGPTKERKNQNTVSD